MFRKIRDGFGATHFTILALGAMFVPTTLYAVVSSQPVNIVNAATGNRALVDNGKLYTFDPSVDPSLGYAFNPVNLVKTFGNCANSSGSNLYTPPSGKALIVKNANFTYYNGTSGSDNYMYLYGDNATIASIESPDAVSQHSASLSYYTSGPLTFACSNGFFRISVTGYLVPSTAVPPAAEAAEHEARVGPQQIKNGKPM